ncbi:MAG: SwmB domain-containing protein [Comamonas sp.]|nr:SwmB domain-containing protein [Comamonas sp.]
MADIAITTNSKILNEVAGNNGAIANTITFTATGGKFAGDNGAVLGLVEGTPKGLQAVLVKTSATTAKLSFTGAAEAHGSGNGNVVKQVTTTDNVAVTAQVDTITLSGTYAEGDEITVSGVATDNVIYTVAAGDIGTDDAATREAIAAKLVTAINEATDKTVTAEATANGQLTLTATTAGTPFTATATETSANGTIAGETTTDNVAAAVAQVNTITLSGTYAAGDKITVSGVAGAAVEYTVLAEDVTGDDAADAEAIAAKLVTAINTATGKTVTAEATAANGVLTLTATTPGTPIDAAVTSTNPADPIPGPTVTFFAKDFVTVDDTFPSDGVVVNDITFAFNNPAAAKTLALVAPTGAGTSETYNKTTLPEITGTAPDGVTKVYIYNNGGTKPVGEATVTDNGWKFKLPTDKLKDGAYNLTASTAADGKGAMTAGFAFTVDTKAPSAPSVTAIKGAISDVTPVLTGKAEKFAKVEVFADEAQTKSLGVTFANAKGVWTLQVEDPALLGAADATYKITAKAIDAAGNETKSKKAVDLTIDTKIDTPTLEATTVAKKNTVALKGKVEGETGGTLQLYGGEDGSVALGKVIKIAKDGSWKSSIKLTEGKHLLSVVATDAAGNVSANSVIDAQATVTIDTFTATPTLELDKDGSGNVIGVKGTAEAGAKVKITIGKKTLEATALADGTWSKSFDGFTPDSTTKAQTIKAVATDTATNVSKPSTAVTHTFVAATPDTTAPTFVSAATNTDGTKVILTYSEALHATTAVKEAFAVDVAGSPNVVTGVAVVGSTVELTLKDAITTGQSVKVGYTAPTADNKVNTNAAIQDTAGNDAATLTATTVVENKVAATGDTTAPEFASVATSDDGKIVLTYDEDLDGTAPTEDLFVVTTGVDDTANAVTDVAVSGKTVTLTLATPIANGVTNINVAYKAPAPDAATTNAAIQDAAGNDAAALPATAVTNTVGAAVDDTAPTISDFIVASETTLTLKSNEAGTAGLYNDSDDALIGTEVTLVKDTTSPAITVAAATGSVVTATLKVSDSATTPNVATHTANKVVIGTADPDTIDLGTANNYVFTFDGADVLQFTNAAASTRVIADFTVGTDKIDLATAAFTELTTASTGALNTADFLSVASEAALTGNSVAAATDAQAIVYLQDTGALYYNTDGDTAGGLVLIATLVGSPNDLAFGDFTATV